MFKDKVVVITGGASGIGRTIADSFKEEGAQVCIIDIKDNPYFVGSVASKKDIEDFASKVLEEYGKVDVLVNNAPPKMMGLEEASYEDFEEAMRSGVVAAFYLTKLFKDNFAKGASIINISSTRAHQSQAQTETYSAAKGALFSLTHSLAVTLAGKVRVNAILPGWIDVDYKVYDGADADQHLVKRVGNPADISNMVLYLASDKADFISGQEFVVDGGMSKLMIYHGDEGWGLGE